jgi:hypothetical protein
MHTPSGDFRFWTSGDAWCSLFFGFGALHSTRLRVRSREPDSFRGQAAIGTVENARLSLHFRGPVLASPQTPGPVARLSHPQLTLEEQCSPEELARPRNPTLPSPRLWLYPSVIWELFVLCGRWRDRQGANLPPGVGGGFTLYPVTSFLEDLASTGRPCEGRAASESFVRQ